MSEDNVYQDADIVWVKLGTSWWPGEVCGHQRQPEGFLQGKRKPYCVVKFFQEDSFEYVKSSKHILPFNCSKKDEFIRKGHELFKAKKKFMEKFPSDVSTAERLTRSVTRSSLFFNSRPDSIVKAILGESPPQTDNTQNGRRCGNVTKIINITPNRNSGTIPTSNSPPTYKCNMCDFQSTRQNVMVLHRRSHSGTATATSKDSLVSSSVITKTVAVGTSPLPNKTATWQTPVRRQKSSELSNGTAVVISDDSTNYGSEENTPEQKNSNISVIISREDDSLSERNNLIVADNSPRKKKGKASSEKFSKGYNRKSEEIQKSLLADWIDEDREDEEEDDDEEKTVDIIEVIPKPGHNPNRPSVSALSSASAELFRRVEHVDQRECAISPVPQRPFSKIRNIPKKDRRNIVFAEFHSGDDPINVDLSSQQTNEDSYQQDKTSEESRSPTVEQSVCQSVKLSTVNPTVEISPTGESSTTQSAEEPPAVVSPAIKPLDVEACLVKSSIGKLSEVKPFNVQPSTVISPAGEPFAAEHSNVSLPVVELPTVQELNTEKSSTTRSSSRKTTASKPYTQKSLPEKLSTVESFTVESSTVEPSTVESRSVELSKVVTSTVQPPTAKISIVEQTSVEVSTEKQSTVEAIFEESVILQASTVEADITKISTVKTSVEELFEETTAVKSSKVKQSTTAASTVEKSRIVEPSTLEQSTVIASVVKAIRLSTERALTVEPPTIKTFTIEPDVVTPSTEKLSTVETSIVTPSTRQLCIAAKPSPVESSMAELSTVELLTTEPSTVEPSIVEPSFVKPSTVEIATVEPFTHEVFTIEPHTDQSEEPITIKPSTVGPVTMETPVGKSSTIEPCIEKSPVIERTKRTRSSVGSKVKAFRRPSAVEPSASRLSALRSSAGRKKLSLFTEEACTVTPAVLSVVEVSVMEPCSVEPSKDMSNEPATLEPTVPKQTEITEPKTLNSVSKASLSCFDFQEEEDTDILTSIAKFKKKYISPEKSHDFGKDSRPKTPDAQKLEMELKDNQLSAEIESLLKTTALPVEVASPSSVMKRSTSFEAQRAPLKERGKRIFKSRNRSRIESCSSVSTTSTMTVVTESSPPANRDISAKGTSSPETSSAQQSHGAVEEDQVDEKLSSEIGVNYGKLSVDTQHKKKEEAMDDKVTNSEEEIVGRVVFSPAEVYAPSDEHFSHESSDNIESHVSSSGMEVYTESPSGSDESAKADLTEIIDVVKQSQSEKDQSKYIFPLSRTEKFVENQEFQQEVQQEGSTKSSIVDKQELQQECFQHKVQQDYTKSTIIDEQKLKETFVQQELEQEDNKKSSDRDLTKIGIVVEESQVRSADSCNVVEESQSNILLSLPKTGKIMDGQELQQEVQQEGHTRSLTADKQKLQQEYLQKGVQEEDDTKSSYTDLSETGIVVDRNQLQPVNVGEKGESKHILSLSRTGKINDGQELQQDVQQECHTSIVEPATIKPSIEKSPAVESARKTRSSVESKVKAFHKPSVLEPFVSKLSTLRSSAARKKLSIFKAEVCAVEPAESSVVEESTMEPKSLEASKATPKEPPALEPEPEQPAITESEAFSTVSKASLSCFDFQKQCNTESFIVCKPKLQAEFLQKEVQEKNSTKSSDEDLRKIGVVVEAIQAQPADSCNLGEEGQSKQEAQQGHIKLSVVDKEELHNEFLQRGVQQKNRIKSSDEDLMKLGVVVEKSQAQSAASWNVGEEGQSNPILSFPQTGKIVDGQELQQDDYTKSFIVDKQVLQKEFLQKEAQQEDRIKSSDEVLRKIEVVEESQKQPADSCNVGEEDQSSFILPVAQTGKIVDGQEFPQEEAQQENQLNHFFLVEESEPIYEVEVYDADVSRKPSDSNYEITNDHELISAQSKSIVDRIDTDEKVNTSREHVKENLPSEFLIETSKVVTHSDEKICKDKIRTTDHNQLPLSSADETVTESQDCSMPEEIETDNSDLTLKDLESAEPDGEVRSEESNSCSTMETQSKSSYVEKDNHTETLEDESIQVGAERSETSSDDTSTVISDAEAEFGSPTSMLEEDRVLNRGRSESETPTTNIEYINNVPKGSGHNHKVLKRTTRRTRFEFQGCRKEKLLLIPPLQYDTQESTSLDNNQKEHIKENMEEKQELTISEHFFSNKDLLSKEFEEDEFVKEKRIPEKEKDLFEKEDIPGNEEGILEFNTESDSTEEEEEEISSPPIEPLQDESQEGEFFKKGSTSNSIFELQDPDGAEIQNVFNSRKQDLDLKALEDTRQGEFETKASTNTQIEDHIETERQLKVLGENTRSDVISEISSKEETESQSCKLSNSYYTITQKSDTIIKFNKYKEVLENVEVDKKWSETSVDCGKSEIAGEELSAVEALLLIPNQPRNILDNLHDCPKTSLTVSEASSVDECITPLITDKEIKEEILEDTDSISQPFEDKSYEDIPKEVVRRKRRSHMKVTPRKRVIEVEKSEKCTEADLAHIGAKIPKLTQDQQSSGSKLMLKAGTTAPHKKTFAEQYEENFVLKYTKEQSIEDIDSVESSRSTTADSDKSTNQVEKTTPEKVHITVDISNPLSSQIASILGTHRPAGTEATSRGVAKKRKQTLEDDIPSFIIKRPSPKTIAEAEAADRETIAQIQNLCPHVEITRKSSKDDQSMSTAPLTQSVKPQILNQQIIRAGSSQPIITVTAKSNKPEEGMFDISNMPIVLSNETIMNEKLHIVITPTSNPQVMKQFQSQQQILLNPGTSTGGFTPSPVNITNPGIPIRRTSNVRTKRTPSRQQLQEQQQNLEQQSQQQQVQLHQNQEQENQQQNQQLQNQLQQKQQQNRQQQSQQQLSLQQQYHQQHQQLQLQQQLQHHSHQQHQHIQHNQHQLQQQQQYHQIQQQQQHQRQQQQRQQVQLQHQHQFQQHQHFQQQFQLHHQNQIHQQLQEEQQILIQQHQQQLLLQQQLQIHQQHHQQQHQQQQHQQQHHQQQQHQQQQHQQQQHQQQQHQQQQHQQQQHQQQQHQQQQHQHQVQLTQTNSSDKQMGVDTRGNKYVIIKAPPNTVVMGNNTEPNKAAQRVQPQQQHQVIDTCKINTQRKPRQPASTSKKAVSHQSSLPLQPPLPVKSPLPHLPSLPVQSPLPNLPVLPVQHSLPHQQIHSNPVQGRETHSNEIQQHFKEQQIEPPIIPALPTTTIKAKGPGRGRRSKQCNKAEPAPPPKENTSKTVKCNANGKRSSGSICEPPRQRSTRSAAANKKKIPMTSSPEVNQTVATDFIPPPIYTTTQQQTQSVVFMAPQTSSSPIICANNVPFHVSSLSPPTMPQVISGISIETSNGSGVGYAVPSLPVLGYPQTFLLCELIDKKYKEVSSKPLYLSPDRTRFFEVPDELVTAAHRKLTDCQREPNPDVLQVISDGVPHVLQPRVVDINSKGIVGHIQHEQKLQQQVNLDKNAKPMQQHEQLSVEEQASALLCLQEQIVQEQIVQEQLVQEQLAQKQLAQEQLVQEQLVQEQLVQEQLVQEHLVQEHLVQEHLVQEHLVQEHLVQEHLVQEHLVQEHLVQEHLVQEHLVQEQLVHEQLVQDHLVQEQFVQEQFIQQQHIEGDQGVLQVATIETEEVQDNIIQQLEPDTVVMEESVDTTSVVLNIGDQQIILDENVFLNMIGQSNVDPNKSTFTLTPEVIQDLFSSFSTPRNIAAVAEFDGEVCEQQQIVMDDNMLRTEDSSTDILTVALDGSGLYTEEQFINSDDVLQIETPEGMRLISTGDGNSGIVFEPMPTSIPARTSETNVLLNQTPKMSIVEIPSDKNKPKFETEPSLEDCLNVIGVAAQSPTVPKSLELPTSVTNPAIVAKTRTPTPGTITMNEIIATGLCHHPDITSLPPMSSTEQELQYEFFPSSSGSHNDKVNINEESVVADMGEYAVVSSVENFDDPGR